MALTDAQIEAAITQTAESFDRKYIEEASKPSASYRVDAQIWSDRDVRYIHGLARPLLMLREMLLGVPSGRVETALSAFYLAYGVGQEGYHEAFGVDGVLATTDFKSDEIYGISPRQAKVIYKTVDGIIGGRETYVSASGHPGFHLPWGWSVGTRFRQYVDDTTAMEGIARSMGS